MSARCLLALAVVTLTAADSAAQYVYDPGPNYYRNDTAEGTVTGGAFGAITGALIGSGSGDAGEGALIGAGVGAIAGNLFGRSQDKADQRQAAYGYAATQRANAQAAALAVTNADLVQMTAAGLDDSVIVGAIHSRGGRFDLSPNGLIVLKQNGVSDNVVRAAQQAVVASPDGVVVSPPPRAVYYHRPPPRYYFHYGRRYCW